MTICNRTTTEAENVTLARLSRLRTSSCDVIFSVPRFESSPCLIICNNHFYYSLLSSDSRESRLTFSQAKSRQCSRVLIANWPQQSSSSFFSQTRSWVPSGDDSFFFDSLIWNSLLRFSFGSVSWALMFAAWDFLTSIFQTSQSERNEHDLASKKATKKRKTFKILPWNIQSSFCF